MYYEIMSKPNKSQIKRDFIMKHKEKILNIVTEMLNKDAPICFNNYDSDERKPITIMQCGHTYCLICLNHLRIYDYKCPKDREQITNQKPNYALLDLINSDTTRVQNQTIKDDKVSSDTSSISLGGNGESYYIEGISFFDSSSK